MSVGGALGKQTSLLILPNQDLDHIQTFSLLQWNTKIQPISGVRLRSMRLELTIPGASRVDHVLGSRAYLKDHKMNWDLQTLFELLRKECLVPFKIHCGESTLLFHPALPLARAARYMPQMLVHIFKSPFSAITSLTGFEFALLLKAS